MVKVGNGFSPFLEKAYRAVNDHPDIMPKLFDLAEFNMMEFFKKSKAKGAQAVKA